MTAQCERSESNPALYILANPIRSSSMNGDVRAVSVSEEVKRLQPKPEVLRELFLKSGNLCAFPGCNHLIMDPDGVFIGQLCHIEAAEKGGERFNPNQTNEDRRALDNLVLFCYEHHAVTNDAQEFPVAR